MPMVLPPELWSVVISFFQRSDWTVPTSSDGVLLLAARSSNIM
jgi:hypothetical protein